MLIRQVFADDLNVILVLQTVLEHLKLQHADNADDNRFHTGIRLAEDLDGALLGDLLDTLDELLALERVFWRTTANSSGANVGMPENTHLCLGSHTVSPMENTPGSKIPIISPAYASSTMERSSCTQLLRCGKHHLLAGLNVQHVLTALKLAGADTHEATRSRCALFMFA